MNPHFATYKKSVQNLRTNPHSATDKYIVDQWEAAKNLNLANIALIGANKKLMAEIDELKQSNANLYAQVDNLETRLQRATGSTPLWVVPESV